MNKWNLLYKLTKINDNAVYESVIVFQVSLNFKPVRETLQKYDVRFILMKKVRKMYPEENISDNEDFRSTILQAFQFEPEKKKNVWWWKPWEKN